MGDWSTARSSAAPIEIDWFAKQWQGIEQVFRLERTARILNTGEIRHQVVYGLSSLSMRQGPPERMLALIRARLSHRKSAALETRRPASRRCVSNADWGCSRSVGPAQ